MVDYHDGDHNVFGLFSLTNYVVFWAGDSRRVGRVGVGDTKPAICVVQDSFRASPTPTPRGTGIPNGRTTSIRRQPPLL